MLFRSVAEVWVHGRSVLNGRCMPLERGKQWEFGVQLPASTAVHHDPIVIRSVLVHEFSHCFFYLAETLRRGPGAVHVETFDPFDDSADRSKMVNPNDWFGVDDVERFSYHDDQALDELQYDVLDLAGILPSVDPQVRFSLDGTIQYPDDVGDRIEEFYRRELWEPDSSS